MGPVLLDFAMPRLLRPVAPTLCSRPPRRGAGDKNRFWKFSRGAPRYPTSERNTARRESHSVSASAEAGGSTYHEFPQIITCHREMLDTLPQELNCVNTFLLFYF